ncbi:MAG TPA: AAA family ATPase [Acidimicrobiia bacterium]
MAVIRAGLSSVMVGRAAELALVRRLVDDLADPQVALIGGEAGVGKTRLVQELVPQLPPATTVLWGHAEQGALGRPWGLLLEAVETRVAQWDAVPGDLAARLDPLRLLLAPVAPRLGGAAERDYGPEELLRATVDLVGHLARPGGAVVVFEDLQWADAESLAVFTRLALTPGLPILLVGTYRAENLDRRRLADLVSDLERRRSVERIELAPLARTEVGEMLDAVTGRAVPLPGVEAVHHRTGGNPFFVEELLMVAGDADPQALARLPLPASLTEAVVGHLDGLGPEERRTVDAAAVLGHRIRFDTLATLTGLGCSGSWWNGASWSSRSPTCSPSATPSPERRSRAGCWAGSAAGSTNGPWTPCGRRAATTGRHWPTTLPPPAGSTTWSSPPGPAPPPT